MISRGLGRKNCTIKLGVWKFAASKKEDNICSE